MSRVAFDKQPKCLADQVALLKNRGMCVPDGKRAEGVLLRLNYYRFTGYALHFEEFVNGQRTHQFKPGTDFDAVVNLYEFDTRLRALLFRYIEPVEVAFRAVLCYELSILTGDPHWYLDQNMYDNRFGFNRLWDECQAEYDRSDEIIIQSYRDKYHSPALPPAWMMSEILSIGRWSRIFKHLADQDARKAVARHFGTKPYYLQSWIHSLSVLRNLCAHHCRIWNRSFAVSPALPNTLKSSVSNSRRLAALIAVLEYLLIPLERSSSFQHDWTDLLASFPEVPRGRMGFFAAD